MITRLTVENFGPIRKCELEFGDLTVVVGPQASGKSLLLQLYHFLEDAEAVYQLYRRNNCDWRDVSDAVLATKLFHELYFGEGLSSLTLSSESQKIRTDGRVQDLQQLILKKSEQKNTSAFYIPAQRTLAFQNGWPRQFSSYAFGTPFSLRFFSETLWNLVDSFAAEASHSLFPVEKRLKQEFRRNIDQSIYWGASVQIHKDANTGAKSIQLAQKDSRGIGYNAWSSGQREFTPLLLGCYHLMPPRQKRKCEWIHTVIIEEPEMGLHPQAIVSFFQLVLELLWRNYRIILSTHSDVILNLVWALVNLQKLHHKNPDCGYTAFTDIFSLPRKKPILAVFNSIIRKSFRTYSFSHLKDGVTLQDISTLDPASADQTISGWGGLTGITDKVVSIIGQNYAEEGYEDGV